MHFSLLFTPQSQVPEWVECDVKQEYYVMLLGTGFL